MVATQVEDVGGKEKVLGKRRWGAENDKQKVEEGDMGSGVFFKGVR